MIAADNVAAIKCCITTEEDANQTLDKNRCSLVDWACFCKSYNVLLYLLEKKADCNQPDASLGSRPLQHCVEEDKWSLMRLLMIVGNADARLLLPRSRIVTLFDMADNETKEFIKAIEAKKQLLKQLQEQYSQQKELADKAYKQAMLNNAKVYYRQAAGTCKAMADWWRAFAEVEKIPILKAHYQKQVERYLKSRQELANYAGIYPQNDDRTLSPSFV